MNKRLSAVLAVSLVCAGLFVFSQRVRSDIAIYSATSGTDNTAGTMKTLSSADLVQMATSDNSHNGTTANWPYATTFDESKYIEFDFTPAVSDGALISSMAVTHQYYTQATLSGVKLEVWDGSSFQDVPISLPSKTGSAGEILETKDLSLIVSSPTIVNALKIRFLAYRSTTLSSVTNLKTYHNYISVSIMYTTPTPTPAPTDSVGATPSDSPSITPTPSPSDTISPDASASATVTPSSTPDVSVVPTPIIDTPIPQPVVFFSPIPTPTPFATLVPIPEVLGASDSKDLLASSSFSPMPEATPSISLAFTPNPLMAVIASPKIIHRRATPLPVASVVPIPSLRPVSRIHRIQIAVVDIWRQLTHYLNMIRR